MAEDQDTSEVDEPEPPIHVSAEEARGAEIVLRGRAMRIVIFAGLAGFVLFVLVFLFFSGR